jgi:hypothetical protein
MQADLFTEITAEEAIAYNGGGFWSKVKNFFSSPIAKSIIKGGLGLIVKYW